MSADGRPLGERPLRTIALLLLAWTLVGCFAGAQAYVHAALDGQSASFGGLAVDRTLSALAWVPATLVAMALTHRFPVRADDWLRPLAVHGAAAVALAYATNVLIRLLHTLAAPAGAAATDLWTAALDGTLRWFHIDVLVYALIAGIAHAVRRRREDRARELRTARLETALTQANLRALKLQLQPHFLFNTLHTIGALWRTNRSDAAEDTLERLSALLRRVLDPDTGQQLTLKEELDFTREYLAIERVRLGDRLRIEIDVDDDVLAAYLPSFVLQPLVENAVRHGISGKAGGGTLRIRAWRDRDELRIAVADDGVGMPSANGGGATAAIGEPVWSAAGRSPEGTDATRGVGLGNTRRRLHELYGGDRLAVEAPASGGTRVVLRVPFRTEP